VQGLTIRVELLVPSFAGITAEAEAELAVVVPEQHVLAAQPVLAAAARCDLLRLMLWEQLCVAVDPSEFCEASRYVWIPRACAGPNDGDPDRLLLRLDDAPSYGGRRAVARGGGSVSRLRL
jgi:hypothetical protein